MTRPASKCESCDFTCKTCSNISNLSKLFVLFLIIKKKTYFKLFLLNKLFNFLIKDCLTCY